MTQTETLTAAEALSRTALFKVLPEEQRQALVSASRPLALRKGQRLFGRGDPGGSMFVVLSGMIEISVSTGDGRKISLNIMGPEHCFGEMSVLDGVARSADAMAISAATLLSIPREAFLRAARQNPELALSLARMLSERIRWISDSVEDYALLPLDRRLARRILILFERFDREENELTISQSDLADFVGATRESTNKILVNWRSRGWIKMGRKSITLVDRKRLDDFAMKHELEV